MANPIYAGLQATVQRLIAKFGQAGRVRGTPGEAARRWRQAQASDRPFRHRDGCARRNHNAAAVSTRLFRLNQSHNQGAFVNKAVQSLQRAFEILNSRIDGGVCEFERSDAGRLLSSREQGPFCV